MRIQHNIAALNSYRNLTNNNNSVSKNLEKLSSGYKINRAGDDAAGLAISEKMRAQITGLETAQKNANDGISLVQTAEGALTEVHSMLNRMVELAGQSANGTYDNDTDRANIQKEVKSLTDEIDRISDGTNFNGINLLDGSLAGSARTGATIGKLKIDKMGTEVKGIKIVNDTSVTADKAELGSDGVITVTFKAGKYTATDLQVAIRGTTTSGGETVASCTGAEVTGSSDAITVSETDPAKVEAVKTKTKGPLSLQIGDTADDFNQLQITVQSMSVKSLGLSDVDLSTQEGAQNAVNAIKTAINTVSSTRGELGANQNRLEHTINNLSVTSENMTAAESRIRDVDMAKEMMSYTKNNILVQASQAMLAQANQIPQGVLQLLQ